MICVRATRIDNSRRTKHGALLDAEILAEVYLELIGARQAQLILVEDRQRLGGRARGRVAIRVRPQPLAPRLTDEEREAHLAFVATLGRTRCGAYLARTICQPSPDDGVGIGPRADARQLVDGAGLRRLHLCDALLIERDEIDRIEQQRREAAVAYRGGYDLARERKQQPRAFDHDQRLQRLLRHVLDPEYAGESQVEGEQHAAAACPPCLRA